MKVSWSPLDKNKFLTYTNSIINLYETRRIQGEPIPKGCLHISDDLYATSLATLSDVHLTKCVEWYPGATSDHLIAIGQANGKVLLSNFGRKGTIELIGKEFIPKHLRHCVYLAWNPVHHNLLAEGLDKHRSDCCISIWDVNTRANSDQPSLTERQRYSSNLAENAVSKPFLEIGMGDTTSSLAWFNKEPRTFITGINGKYLRVYDLRDASKPHLMTHTKYVHGVCSDPLHESRVAAYSENHVAIWDVRNFDKPILTLPTDRAILKIDWCPTRPGFLGALCRDSSVVKLYDIRHTVIGPDELEPVTFERNIQPYRQHQVVHFAWHPTCENRIITVTPTGNLKDNQIYEKLPISLSPCMNLSWVFSRRISIQDCGTELDMAARIKLRALQGYGLHSTELWNNAVVVADEPHLHALWHWLDLSTNILRANEPAKKPRSSRYIGVLDLLAQGHADHHSDYALNCWQYPDGLRSNSHERKLVYQYKSDARSQALQLCGWWFFGKEQNNTSDPLALLLNSMVSENHEYERAAAIALFNLKIGTAVKILSCETAVKENPVLSMVAMALAGFTEEKNALWRKTCTDLRQSLEHPYLRAMFAFLASDKDNYDDVLKDDPCMAVKDRVAFACIYLNDTKEHRQGSVSQIDYTPFQLASMVGSKFTEVPDDVIVAALNLLKTTCDNQVAPYIGYFTPAEIKFGLATRGNTADSLVKARLPDETFSVNIHPLPGHWVTSCYRPEQKEIHVYDSVRNQIHYEQVLPQLRLVYGNEKMSHVVYKEVTQQGFDPLCGVMACAFAFTCVLGNRPECCSYDTLNAREHLRNCLMTGLVSQFPEKRHFQQFKTPLSGVKRTEQKREYDKLRKQKSRQNQNVREKERQNDKKRKVANRMSDIYRQKERLVETQLKKTKRTEDSFRKIEQKENTLWRRNKRAQSPVRLKEQQANTCRRRRIRAESPVRRKEQQTDTCRRRRIRAESPVRRKEQQTDTCRRRRIRAESPVRRKEQQADTCRRRRIRAESPLRRNEQQADTRRRKVKREDFETNQKETEQERKRKRKIREDPVIKEIERLKKKQQRTDRRYCIREKNSQKQRKKEKEIKKTVDDMIEEFKSAINIGCDYRCTCCHQLFFRHSVVASPQLKVSLELRSKCNIPTSENLEDFFICHTCLSHLRRNKIPPLSVANNVKFPALPEELKVNRLEERLISPVNVFMQLRELPRGDQRSICGNVVNVPADNISTVSILPRRLDCTNTVPVKLKRRLRYKSHYMFENVRPEKCLQATRYLLTKELFRNFVSNGVDEDWLQIASSNTSTVEPTNEEVHISEGNVHTQDITVQSDEDNESILSCMSSGTEHRVVQTSSQVTEMGQNTDKSGSTSDDGNIQSTTDDDNTTDDDSETDKDAWTEDDDEAEMFSFGEMDTMLHPDITSAHYQKTLNVAPSEGNVPISIFSDNVEELAFPTIFCGEKRPPNKERTVAVKYSDICKSELRNSDRRAAANITNIFFKARKLQLKQIQDRVWLSVRRNKTKGKQYTAKDVRDKETVENMVKLDEGFRIFRTLRGSPPYWESAKKDMFSMIRQLGLPTWFISLSAAETHWKPLLRCLYKISEGETLSDDDIEAFTWTDKTKLISSDPVSVARYFDFRVQQFFSLFVYSQLHPLGKILDHFYRVEFQHRGSPHIHGLLWVDNSPKLDEVPDEELCNFIDSYVSTLRSEPLSKYQLHRHSHTCKKRKKAECRFNIPYPPVPDTMVIRPLVDENEDVMSKAQEDFQTIQTALKDLGMGAEMTLEEFLLTLDLTLDDYLLAIRSSVSEPKIFIKRQPDAVRVNAFSPHILTAWEANHDIQFVTDAYACAIYIVSYISKGQRGMSELLRKTCEEARQTGSDIRSQVRAIGNKFTRHSEMSAQEAVYLTLQLPLRRCSRSFIFVNTSPPEERPFILKPEEQLKILPDDSEDIAAENVISRYTQRPRSLNKLCLADFAAWYDLNTAKKKDSTQNTETPESDLEDNRDDDPSADEQVTLDSQITLQNGTSMRKRRTKKIIRFVRYNEKTDPENHFRELLMLFTAWRHEGALIGDSSSYEERYMSVKEENDSKRSEYYSLSQDFEVEAVQEEDSEMFSNVAPSTQHRNDLDENDNTVREEEDQYINYDIGRDIGMSDQAGSDITEETIKNRVSDEQFRKDVRSLNKKQREFFDHVLMKVKTTNEQLFLFLTGGAGVGKTKLTKTLYQALLRHYNSTAGDNPEQINILLTAPTGKAAYLIGGNTIHSAFSVPANQGFRYKSMVAEKLNSMRTKLGNLKFLFIDEISMCGSNLFYFIDNRIRDIMQRQNVPFGGVSVLCIGDLFQLSPVRDKWIFRGASSVDDFGVLAPNVWVENIQMFELTEIMRQAEDKKFAEALNNVREGKHNNVDLQLLQSRLVSKTTMEDYSTTHIFYYNAAVQQHNITAFNNCTGHKAECNASDIVIGDVQHAVKIKVLKSAPTRAGDSMGLAKSLVIGVGLRVELTLNLDVDDGLVNGAAGVCKFITCNENSIPRIIWILFDQEVLGKQRRTAMKHLYQIDIDRSWTSISPVSRQFPVGKYKNVKVQRTQFPLQLAAGKTVHRSQGDTLDKIVVQLPDRRSPHMHYVALSRVTTLNGLKILNPFNPEKITVSGDVKTEMARLRETSAVTLCFTPLYTYHDVFSICFLNVQSLPLHLPDIKCDRNLMTADTLMLVETKLCSRDKPETLNIPDYNMLRYDHSHQRSAYGTVIYTRKDNVLVANEKRIDSEVEIVYIHIIQPLCIHVFSVYAKPNTKLTTIKKDISSALKDIDGLVIVMGDFNCEGQKKEQLETNMETHGLQQKVKMPTTNSNTTLDLVFTNIQEPHLSSYLSELSKHLKETGNLDGLLLTGLTNEEGVELLGNYVNYTSDVQTATLAVIYSSPSEISKDERVLTWIESYRGLLDRWQLWHQRAKFDIIRHSVDKTRVPSQAFVSCNFCGKTIACNMALAARSRPSAYSSLPPTNRPKITCCPGCRKPLPRCALCLTNLGTPSGSGLCQIKDKSEYEGKLSSFDSWFTWCQTCRHGGHSSHVTDWFSEHVECPVTGCQCKCMTLDPNSQLIAETSNLHQLEADT